MNSNHSIVTTIQSRKSVRTYSLKTIPGDLKDRIQKTFDKISGPFDIRLRFKWLDIPDLQDDEKITFGTYGVVLGATNYIAGAVKKGNYALEQIGYGLESLILTITSLGLSTCWMGGTFSRSQFARAMHLTNDEWLPAITPVGYPSWARGPIDVLFKPIPGRIRFPWHKIFFFENLQTPLTQASAGDYAVPLEMLRIAPSAANRQPWRIIKQGNQFHFLLAHSLGYETRYDFDIQKIDLGIAMFHFEATAREKGSKGNWQVKAPTIHDLSHDWEYIVTWQAK
jgi:hypothetical protein